VKLSRKQIESRKARAVSFTRDVVGDPERADEIADESLESYAERRGFEFEIANPRSDKVARRKSVADLEEELANLTDEFNELVDVNEALESQLSEIGAILGVEEVEEEEGEEEDEEGEE
jgi:lipoate-protein ligase A